MKFTASSRLAVCGAVGIVSLLVTLAPNLRAQGNTSLGTWKLNLAKSKYDPGPAPLSDTRVYEAWEGDGRRQGLATRAPNVTTR
jgi:hypothetical protein